MVVEPWFVSKMEDSSPENSGQEDYDVDSESSDTSQREHLRECDKDPEVTRAEEREVEKQRYEAILQKFERMMETYRHGTTLLADQLSKIHREMEKISGVMQQFLDNSGDENLLKEGKEEGQVENSSKNQIKQLTGKKFIECWICNQPGHLRRHCKLGTSWWYAPQPMQSGWRAGFARTGKSQGEWTPGRCWLCMQEGHKRKFCPKRNQSVRESKKESEEATQKE